MCHSVCVCVRALVCHGVCARVSECVHASSCASEGASECAGVCVYSYSRWMCVKCFLVLMYVFTVLFLCFSDCHEGTCAFLIVMLILIYALFYWTCDYFSVCEML